MSADYRTLLHGDRRVERWREEADQAAEAEAARVRREQRQQRANAVDQLRAEMQSEIASLRADLHQSNEVQLGQRFLGSNHIRRPRRACRTKYG